MTGAVPDDSALERAAKALAAGELVVFPTETVYGIGCDALSPTALARLCLAKRRPAEKGIAVILADESMLEQVTGEAGPAARALARSFWPGPLTLLVPARPELPDAIVRDGKIGCRVSGDPLARELSRLLGRPLASPSANPSDLAPAHDVEAARRYFGDRVSVYLDGGERSGEPSTLIDPGPPLRVLRPGPIRREDLESALGTSG